MTPNKFVGRETELSNRIATLHELGHAKQWIEKPDIFVRPITKARAEIREMAMRMATGGVRKAGATVDHILKSDEMPPLFTAWDPVVEMDNMSRHEWPICQEIGIGYRKNYCDPGGKNGGHGLQLSELLRRAIEAKEAEDRAASAAKSSDVNVGAGLVWTCRVNPDLKISGAMRINTHKLKCEPCRKA